MMPSRSPSRRKSEEGESDRVGDWFGAVALHGGYRSAHLGNVGNTLDSGRWRRNCLGSSMTALRPRLRGWRPPRTDRNRCKPADGAEIAICRWLRFCKQGARLLVVLPARPRVVPPGAAGSGRNGPLQAPTHMRPALAATSGVEGLSAQGGCVTEPAERASSRPRL